MDPDPGFSVGGLRGAGDPLRPQAPQSEEQPKKCAYALERFFFTYDQSTYLFRWDPDPGFSVGGLRGAGDPLRAQLRGAGDPLRPQAPP